ncbi:MAG: IS66 family transposase [Nanoarchaeota archaeon]|nr:IS66 family transposase [Nanoarchaeota archaeon]
MSGWRQRVRDLEAENEFLREKIEALEKRLLAYENPHTPPSLLKKKKPPKNEPSGKLGAPVGHPRYERKEPEPTMSVEYLEETCPHCRSKLEKPFKIVRVIEEEIPEPQPIEVTEHLIGHYHCPKCKKHIIAKNNAPKGRFGNNLLTHVTLLKFDDRLPLRKAVSSLERHYGITITNVAALNATENVALKLEKPYKQLMRRIRKSGVIYADETKIKVNGKTYWIWTFVSEKETLFVIRKSRAKKVIEEILGTVFQGIICCDGWTAYSQYSINLQRCWAHLLREAKHLAEKFTEFEGFYQLFKKIFERIKEVRLKPPSLREREEIRDKLKIEMEQMIEQMNYYQEFRKFATKVKNGIQYWFTCLVNLFVEPTNNTAERALRELVVQRKIIGGLRRERGANIMQTIMSMITTWKQQGLQLFSTMKSYL